MHPKEDELPDESKYEEPSEYAPEPANNGLDSQVADPSTAAANDEWGTDDD